MELLKIFNSVDNNNLLTKEELKFLLEINDKENLDKLFSKAYEVKLKNIGNKVFFRGIIQQHMH